MTLTYISFLVAMVTACLFNKQVMTTSDVPTRLSRGEPENLTSLLTGMLDGYNTMERPFYRVKPVTVYISVYINAISHISEENMEFEADMYFRELWFDPRLAFGHENDTVILQRENVNKIWRPDVIVSNAKKTVKDVEAQTVYISGNGNVYRSSRMILLLSVDMNLHNYPMDEQDLKIDFVSYGYDVSMMSTKWTESAIANLETTSFLLESPSFNTELHEYISGVFEHLVLSIRAKRRIAYFLTQFYFPCNLCAMISWFPFWMDRYSIGDRLALSVTILLTEMFLSQYINSSMPKVSYIKAADWYILISYLFMFLALLENILVYLSRKDVRKKTAKKPCLKVKISEAHANPATFSDLQLHQDETPTSIGPDPSEKYSCSNGCDEHDHRDQITEPRQSEKCSCLCNEQHDQQSNEPDISLKIDQLSRIAFPVCYVIFVALYFTRALTYSG